MTFFTGPIGCLILIFLFILIIGVLFKGAFALLFSNPVLILIIVAVYFFFYRNNSGRGGGGTTGKKNTRHVEYEIFDDEDTE